jgi:hypothetical protein
MSARDLFRVGSPDEVVPYYAPANERVAKLVAFVGSYFIWVVLAALVCAVAMLAI